MKLHRSAVALYGWLPDAVWEMDPWDVTAFITERLSVLAQAALMIPASVLSPDAVTALIADDEGELNIAERYGEGVANEFEAFTRQAEAWMEKRR